MIEAPRPYRNLCLRLSYIQHHNGVTFIFILSQQVDIFAQYRDYIDNFTIALRSIRKLNKTSERFRSTLKVCQRETGGDKLSLVNHLLAPVRRMPNYVLYIKVRICICFPVVALTFEEKIKCSLV